MANILVTAAGGGIGVNAVQTIQDTTDHKVIGTDVKSKHGGLYICDDYFVVPRADQEKWIPEMAEIIEKEEIDLVMPLIDMELQKIPDLRRKIYSDVSFLVPRDEILTATYNKLECNKMLESHGITVPKSRSGDNLSDFPRSAYPAVIKTKTGQGNSLGTGVDLVSTQNEADAVIQERDETPDNLFIEEYIGGIEYTTEIITTTDNTIIGVVPKEAISTEPYHRVTRDAPNIRASSRRIAKKLQPAGVLNIQQIVAENKIYTIEINPRFSASSSLTAAAGVNGYKLAIREKLSLKVNPVYNYERDMHLYRYPQNVHITK
jgi:carbamoyl-phosphate synthase large subunit